MRDVMSPYVTELDPQLHGKLLKYLEDQGFEILHPPYTKFQGKKKGLICTLYLSGKMVAQGKDLKEFIEFYVEPELTGVVKQGYEEHFIDKRPRIGVDEAGKGDFFGPLCIAGVYAGEKELEALLKIGVKDSKLMGDPAILKMAAKIRAAVPHHVIRISPEKYNELYDKFHNLNYLLAWGHGTVIEVLSKATGCKTAHIDQFTDRPLVENELKKKKLEIDFTKKTKGESDPVVAAASILARESFVKGIDWMSEKLGVTIPKGASAAVKLCAMKLLKQHGKEIFYQISKAHFKTLDEIVKKSNDENHE